MSLIRRRMLWLSAAAASLIAAGAAAQGTGTPGARRGRDDEPQLPL